MSLCLKSETRAKVNLPTRDLLLPHQQVQGEGAALNMSQINFPKSLILVFQQDLDKHGEAQYDNKKLA